MIMVYIGHKILLFHLYYNKTKCECFFNETPYISLLFCMFLFIFASNKECDMLSN